MKWEVDRAVPPSDPMDPRGRRIRFDQQAPPVEVVEADRAEVTQGGALVFLNANGEPVRAFGPTGWVTLREFTDTVQNPNIPGPPDRP